MNESPPQSTGRTDQLKELRRNIAALVRVTNELPSSGEGFELYATFPEFIEFMSAQRNRIIIMIRKILHHSGIKPIKITESKLEDMDRLVMANDQLIEQIARALDEYQTSLNRDRIKVRQISLGAEHIPGGQSSVAPTSAAASFKKTFKDGAGRYAVLSRPIQTIAPSMQNKTKPIDQQKQISGNNSADSANAPLPRGFAKNNVEIGQKNMEKKKGKIIVNEGNGREFAATKERARRIHRRLNAEFASPYDRYLVAMQQQSNVGNIKPKIEMEGNGEYSAQREEEEKGMDGIGAIGIEEEEEEEVVVGKKEMEEEEDEERRIFFSDPANLTKAARKKMRKKLRKGADVQLV